jgi:Dimerisation domain
MGTTKPEAAAQLLELIQMRLISEAIHVAAALGVADLLAAGPKSAEELGEATGASAPSLHRVMRALASFGIFSRDSAGRFALAPLGEFLKRDLPGSLHSAALFFGGETGTSTVRLFLECVKTGESATQKLAGGKGVFQWLQSDPELTKLTSYIACGR